MDLTCVGRYDADTILSDATNGAVIILAYTDPNSGKTFFYCTVSAQWNKYIYIHVYCHRLVTTRHI